MFGFAAAPTGGWEMHTCVKVGAYSAGCELHRNPTSETFDDVSTETEGHRRNGNTVADGRADIRLGAGDSLHPLAGSGFLIPKDSTMFREHSSRLASGRVQDHMGSLYACSAKQLSSHIFS